MIFLKIEKFSGMWITFFIEGQSLLALVKAEQMLMIRTGHVPKFIRVRKSGLFVSGIFLGKRG